MPQPKGKDWLKDTKTRPLYMLPTRDPSIVGGHIQTENAGMGKDISHKWRQKKKQE